MSVRNHIGKFSSLHLLPFPKIIRLLYTFLCFAVGKLPNSESSVGLKLGWIEFEDELIGTVVIDLKAIGIKYLVELKLLRSYGPAGNFSGFM